MSENVDSVVSENKNHMHQLSEIDRLTAIVGQLVQDFKNLRDFTETQAQSLAALFRAIDEGKNLTTSNIYDCLVSIRVAQLDHMVKQQIANGFLKPAMVVGQRSMVICKQMSQDLKEINRKISLPVFDMQEEFKVKFLDKKVGDTVLVETPSQKDSSTQIAASFHILEIYDVVDQTEKSY